ncbi:MAG TPA: hypothetical protein ENJ51_06500 [Leucothrix mucor]|uniref:Sulfur relay protein DsrC n=1 Tax=Leucothrix mucor TaxID=45248 RepID=A0A7V2SZM4_LEUMU|nr:hypothetical protein [Leucothrix mucor]
MLLLSAILLQSGDDISSFDELKQTIQTFAIETGELFFQVDIEPPNYGDRPDDWHEQLNLAFESAR